MKITTPPMTKFQVIPMNTLSPEVVKALHAAGRRRVFEMLVDLVGNGNLMMTQAEIVIKALRGASN